MVIRICTIKVSIQIVKNNMKNMMESENTCIKCGCFVEESTYKMKGKNVSAQQNYLLTIQKWIRHVYRHQIHSPPLCLHASVWFVGRKWERIFFCAGLAFAHIYTHCSMWNTWECSIDFDFYSTWLNVMLFISFLFTSLCLGLRATQ